MSYIWMSGFLAVRFSCRLVFVRFGFRAVRFSSVWFSSVFGGSVRFGFHASLSLCEREQKEHRARQAGRGAKEQLACASKGCAGCATSAV